MGSSKLGRPAEILLVEDNPGDVELTQEALEEAKVQQQPARGRRRRGGHGLPAPRGQVRQRPRGRT